MADTNGGYGSGFIDGITSKNFWNDAGNDISNLFSGNTTDSTAYSGQTTINGTTTGNASQSRLQAMSTAAAERDKSSQQIQNFSNNLWVSSANDQLAAKDVYSPLHEAVVSNAAKKQTSLIEDISNKLDLKKISSSFNTSSNDTGLLKDLKSAYSSVQSHIKSAASTVSGIGSAASSYITTIQTGLNRAVRAYNAVDRLKKASAGTGTLTSRISGVSRNLGTSMTALGMPPDTDTRLLLSDINRMTVTSGTLQRTTNSSSGGKIRAIAQGLGALTGDTGLVYTVDSGARLFSGIGLVNSSAKARVPGVTKRVVDSLGSGYATKVAAGSLRSVAKSSNIEALRELNAVVDNGVLKKINPNVVAVFAKSFKYTEDYSVPGKKSLYTETIQTFNTVDPDWCRNSIGPDGATDDTLDLTTILNSSSPFKDLISIGSLNTNVGDKLLGFGTVFKKTDVLTELKKSFPRTVVTANTVTRKVH